MINLHNALFALNPAIKVIREDVAYDDNNNEIAYDLAQAQAKLAELQAQAKIDVQKAVDAKQSALSKLTALGLTEDEVKALLGVA
jgi:hypothetical protein